MKNKVKPQDYTKILVLGLAYFVAAYFGLKFAINVSQVTLLWPASGIALAALLLYGYRLWPGILLGSFAANFLIAPDLPAVDFIIAVGSTLQALAGTYLISKADKDFSLTLDNIKSYIVFILFGALAAPFVASTIGTASLVAGGAINIADYWAVWRIWWLGDLMGVLLLGTLILTLSKRENVLKFITLKKEATTTAIKFFKTTELVALLLIVFGLLYLTFFLSPESARSFIFFLIFPVFIWSSTRFNQAVTALCVLIVSVVVFLSSLYFPTTPIPEEELESRLFGIQYLMGVIGLIAMALSVSVRERDNLKKEAEKLNIELKKEVRARDRFLAMLSHELRNPLVPITNALELLNMKDVEDKEIEEYINMINRQVKNTTNIINDLLDVSRIMHGKFELHKEEFDIKELAEETLKALDKTIKESNVAFHVSFPGKPILVYADPGRIEQLITNLIANALKYTPNPGEVGLKIAQHRESIVISVKDTGVGIAKEDLERVFELFTQLKQSMTRTKGGLGVGLMVVNYVAESHGGKAEVKSEGAGKGAEFIIRLPIVAPHK